MMELSNIVIKEREIYIYILLLTVPFVYFEGNRWDLRLENFVDEFVCCGDKIFA